MIVVLIKILVQRVVSVRFPVVIYEKKRLYDICDSQGCQLVNVSFSWYILQRLKLDRCEFHK